jgi:hypothetical protein
MANKENKAPETTEEVKENETPKTEEKVKDERVEIFVPRGYANDDPNLLISVNGVNYVLPRGKKPMVPACVAYEFRRSQKAQEKLDQNMEQMLEASK